MTSNSDSSNDNKSIRLEKLTVFNWVQWNSWFMLYLKILFDKKLVEDKNNQVQYKKKNNKALNAFLKDLHNDILKNNTSFNDAWTALASACGKDLVITICAAYRKVNQMKDQPGASLKDHIANFKRAYTKLANKTANHIQEFGTVTLFMSA
jgi:hypothetical protein